MKAATKEEEVKLAEIIAKPKPAVVAKTSNVI